MEHNTQIKEQYNFMLCNCFKEAQDRNSVLFSWEEGSGDTTVVFNIRRKFRVKYHQVFFREGSPSW